MTGKTHTVVGVAVGAAVGTLIPSTVIGSYPDAIVLATAIAGGVGGLLPDSDLKGTKGRMILTGVAGFGFGAIIEAIYSRRNEGISLGEVSTWIPLFLWAIVYFAIVLKQASHRGFTHSITALVITSLVTVPIAVGNARVIGLAFVAGIASHLLIDLLNTKGEQLFWPAKSRFCFNLCKANGPADKVIFAIASVAVIAILALNGIENVFDLSMMR